MPGKTPPKKAADPAKPAKRAARKPGRRKSTDRELADALARQQAQKDAPSRVHGVKRPKGKGAQPKGKATDATAPTQPPVQRPTGKDQPPARKPVQRPPDSNKPPATKPAQRSTGEGQPPTREPATRPAGSGKPPTQAPTQRPAGSDRPPGQTPAPRQAGNQPPTQKPTGPQGGNKQPTQRPTQDLPGSRPSTPKPVQDPAGKDQPPRREPAPRPTGQAQPQTRTPAKRPAESNKPPAKKLRRQVEQEDRYASPPGLDEHLRAVAQDDPYPDDRPINPIPALQAGHEEVDRRLIEEDRSLVRITYDTDHNRHIYEVIEPLLDEREAAVLDFVRDTLVRTLDGRRGDEQWDRYLRHATEEAVLDHDIMVDRVSLERIHYHIRRDFLGYGPIDVMMHDPMLEDISCDGPSIPIYVFHREYGSIRSNVIVEDEEAIDGFVIRLAQRSKKHISIAEPLLDATLPDGSRLQASLSREVTSHGSTFTIRKFRAEPMTPPDLVALGTMDPAMAAYFWFLMEEGRSLLYAGGTASGKTTSLNAVCQFIPPAKKIVSIEDTREINLLHENWIPGVTRAGFGNETAHGNRAGSIDMYRLLEAALRQRPEYLIVGEVRGKEALTLFQAMATGHAVYSTMHADSVKSAVYRLENRPIDVPRMMLQTLDTVAIQAQVKVNNRSVRRIKEVVEIIGFDPDTEDLLTNTVFRWDVQHDRHMYTGHSEVFEQIMDKRGWNDEEMERRWVERIRVVEYMRREGIRDFQIVGKIVQEYYRRPAQLMERIKDRLPDVGVPAPAASEAAWD